MTPATQSKTENPQIELRAETAHEAEAREILEEIRAENIGLGKWLERNPEQMADIKNLLARAFARPECGTTSGRDLDALAKAEMRREVVEIIAERIVGGAPQTAQGKSEGVAMTPATQLKTANAEIELRAATPLETCQPESKIRRITAVLYKKFVETNETIGAVAYVVATVTLLGYLALLSANDLKWLTKEWRANLLALEPLALYPLMYALIVLTACIVIGKRFDVLLAASGWLFANLIVSGVVIGGVVASWAYGYDRNGHKIEWYEVPDIHNLEALIKLAMTLLVFSGLIVLNLKLLGRYLQNERETREAAERWEREAPARAAAAREIKLAPYVAPAPPRPETPKEVMN